jgi:hypothetical protein
MIYDKDNPEAISSWKQNKDSDRASWKTNKNETASFFLSEES